MKSLWKEVKLLPEDKIFGLSKKFGEDTADKKISLIIGAYRDEKGKPYVFEVVKKVEKEMLAEGLNKEYLSIEGDADFRASAKKLVFGEECKISDRVNAFITL